MKASATSTATLLRQVATSAGFDLDQGVAGGWLAFASTQTPLRVWLRVDGGEHLAALSLQTVARSLDEGALGKAASVPLPAGAVAARAVPQRDGLRNLLRRAFRLSRNLSEEPLQAFEEAVAALPRSTEAERLVVQRVGQDLFRAALLKAWDGRCAVTGLDVADLLRASHVKPWAYCETDAERLDVHNGLLLAAHLDAAFDGGLVTFSDTGEIVFSSAFPAAAQGLLGMHPGMRLRRVEDGHRVYLPWHRAKVFLGV
jgi:hypothetical protein